MYRVKPTVICVLVYICTYYIHTSSGGSVPTVITVLSEEGGSNRLKQELEEELVTLAQELQYLNFSFSNVQRFGE